MNVEKLTDHIIELKNNVAVLQASHNNIEEKLDNILISISRDRIATMSNTEKIVELRAQAKIYGTLFMSASAMIGGIVSEVIRLVIK